MKHLHNLSESAEGEMNKKANWTIDKQKPFEQ